MSIGLLFWLLMVIWLIFGFWSNRSQLSGGDFAPVGGSLLLFILLFLLGWHAFGFIIHG